MTFLVVVLVMGASGIIAQLLLLRELLITFLSNELSIGIILANWLLLEAAGSFFLGRLIDKVRRKTALFVAVTVTFSLSFPAAIIVARTWKPMIGIFPGEGMGLHQIFLASFLILLPVSFTHGALFTFASRIQAGLSGRGAAGIGRVYFLENVGTLVGGLLFTFLLITHMNSVEAAFAVSLTNMAVCLPLLLLREAIDEGGREESRPIPSQVIAGLTALAAAGAAFILLGPLSGDLHEASIGKQWEGQQVVHYENSVYGNMAVIEREGEYTFFSDGVPAITTPSPDLVLVEEFSHLSLLHHPSPRDILVIGGGAGGVLRELLKHPVTRIDYVELDPLLLSLLEKFPTELTAAELSDPRVEVFSRDGRLYLKETDRRYDVVLVGFSEPRDLQVNRFFTRQFFSLLSSRLKGGGVVAFTLPGSLTYMGPAMRDLNACIVNTLGDVFPGLRVIPGDGANIIIASPSPDLSTCDVDCLEERFEGAGLPLSFLDSSHLRHRLDPRWTAWFADSMGEATEKRNDDFRPLGVFYSLSHWNAKFAPRLQGIVSRAGEVSFPLVAGAAAIAALPFLLLAGMRKKKVPGPGVVLAVFSTGFAGMIFDLALIFTFQALYGVVFSWIGLLVTAFMAGSAAGSFAMTRIMERLRRDAALFMGIEGALVAFSLLLPVTFLAFESYLEQPGLATVIRVMFLLLSFLSGLLTGLQFPLAGKIMLGSSTRIGGAAGLLYGADLIGGWVGGIVGGVILLPILGLVETCLVLAVLKFLSLLLVAASSRRVGEGGVVFSG